MKILVLGAGGMKGHVITLRLKAKGHAVTGFARRSLPFCDTVISDANNVEALKRGLHSGSFDAVVNCAGILNRAVDANPYDGIWLNSCFPHLLAEMTKDSDTRVIHLSTDCVFSGHDNGNYKEDDFRSADTFYGRSKALGELNDNKNLTFRTSVVGPDINEDGIGLFNWFMKQSGEVSGYTGAIWTGVTTMMLADAIDAALEQGLTGIYHLVNGAKISKYELLKLFNSLRKTPVEIRPADTVHDDKSLVNTRKDFRFEVPDYEQMISGMRDWIYAHQDLYQLLFSRGVL